MHRAAILFLLLVTPLHAEVYRWVDEQGNVHFSDRKPVGYESQQVQVHAPAPAAEPDEGELRRLELVRQAEERFRETVKLAPPLEDAPFDRAGACRDARRNYGALQEVMPVYRAEDGNLRPQWQGDYYQGERQYVADEDREALQGQVWLDVLAHCDQPEDLDAMRRAYDDWIAAEHCEIARQRLSQAERPQNRTPLDELQRLRQAYRASCG
jgi:hypothetical protein